MADRAVERIRCRGRVKSEVSGTEDVVTTRPSEVRVEEPRILVPVNVAVHVWNELEMTEVFKGCGFAKRDVLLTQAEVFGRLIAPMGEYATVELVQRTAMSDMLGKEAAWIKKDALYRITDKLIIAGTDDLIAGSW